MQVVLMPAFDLFYSWSSGAFVLAATYNMNFPPEQFFIFGNPLEHDFGTPM